MSLWTTPAHQLLQAQARILAEIVLDTNPDEPTPTRNKMIGYRSAAGDQQRLRLIPAIARGVAGAIPGTNPLQALLAKERRATPSDRSG